MYLFILYHRYVYKHMHASKIMAVQESANVLNKSWGLILCKATLVPEGCKSLRFKRMDVFPIPRLIEQVHYCMLYHWCFVSILLLYQKNGIWRAGCRRWSCPPANDVSKHGHAGFWFLKQLATFLSIWINMQHFTMSTPSNLHL